MAVRRVVTPRRLSLAVIAAAACASSPTRAKDAQVADESSRAPSDAGVALPASPVGTLEVKVTWPGAPSTARRVTTGSCGERRPLAEIHTLHGVRDVVVWLDGVAPGAPTAVPELSIDHCQVSPRALVSTSGAVVIRNASEHRRHVEAVRLGDLGTVDKLAKAGKPQVAIELPLVGAAARIDLAPAGIFRLDAGDVHDPSFVVVSPSRSAVTSELGIARFGELAPGRYRVVAWLPPAGLIARGQIDLAAGATAELSLVFGEPAAAGAKPAKPDRPGDQDDAGE